MDSIWTQTAKLPAFEKLQGDRRCDVLIVGGGLCGLLCAYFLQQAGVDYLLVEAKRLGSGITKNTTAKITSQHGLIYHKLGKRFGLERAGLYLHANEEALKQYQILSQTMDCDFQEKPAYVYAMDDSRKIDQELDTLQRLGYPARFAKSLPLPFSVAGALRFDHQAQFHPLKLMAELAKNLNICEHTKVLELQPHKAVTDGGMIRAKKIVICTHFPYLNKHGAYFLKLYQHRSYVLALKDGPQLDGMFVDEAMTGLSFRNQGELLLLGGGSHRTGKKGGNWQELRDFAKHNYPTTHEVAHWATQDCMSLDQMPYIGSYSKGTEDLYVATGFNKWGMTSSMVAAQLLRDLLLEKESPYQELFSPSRSMLQPQLLVNGLEATVNLLTPTVPRCPHMGCALKYNKEEHSWDCPCHGSRFGETGELLDNPASDDKKK